MAERVSDERLKELIKLSSYGSERRHAYEELQSLRATLRGVEAFLENEDVEIVISKFDEHRFWCEVKGRYKPTDDSLGDSVIEALAALVETGGRSDG